MYSLYILDEGEELALSHPVMMTAKVGKSVLFAQPGEGAFYTLTKKFEQRMRNCSYEMRLSECVGRRLDEEFGECSGDVVRG